jgi:ABC-2 type transport system ATP-binding protein
LDEPTSGVDPITRANFWSIIKGLAKQGVTVFVTTHYMDEAENCDRMTLIYKGTIIAMGTPEEMKTKFMKSEIIQIRVDEPEQWTERLSAIEGVEESALFGSAIHVVSADAKKTIPLIKELFRQEGLKDYKMAKIKASLEDVFVSLIEDYDKEHPA